MNRIKRFVFEKFTFSHLLDKYSYTISLRTTTAPRPPPGLLFSFTICFIILTFSCVARECHLSVLHKLSFLLIFSSILFFLFIFLIFLLSPPQSFSSLRYINRSPFFSAPHFLISFFFFFHSFLRPLPYPTEQRKRIGRKIRAIFLYKYLYTV